MGRKYDADELKENLVKVLQESKVGMSGTEISRRLNVNRITMTKYLEIFSAEGLVNQKNIGNVTLWFVDPDTKKYRFPDDYFEVQKCFTESLSKFSGQQACGLIRNSLQSGATTPLLITEVIVPAISFIRKLFKDGKIGTAEESLLKGIITDAIKTIKISRQAGVSEKNVIILAADSESQLMADAASALYSSDEWNVFLLGNMSSAVDILFDLDLQKLLSKIWKKKRNVMLIVVFSSSEGGLNFFADTINTVKKNSGKKLFSIMSGPIGKKTKINTDLLSDDLGVILQWSQNLVEKSPQ